MTSLRESLLRIDADGMKYMKVSDVTGQQGGGLGASKARLLSEGLGSGFREKTGVRGGELRPENEGRSSVEGDTFVSASRLWPTTG